MKQLLFLIAIIFSIAINAQHTVKGKVCDANTKEPIAGVKVGSCYTNQNGEFYYKCECGCNGNCNMEQDVEVSKKGYENRKESLSATGSNIIFLDEKSINIEQVVITSNREFTKRSDVPLAISKISAKTIEETKANQVVEIVNKTPGVMMVNLGNEQHSMSIRQPMTTNAYYLYLEDGVPIRPMGIFNHNALLEINQYTISSMEVVKGPVSSIYGPEAVGGAINFISQKPTAIPTAKIGYQQNFIGYQRLQASAGATLGKFGFYVGGMKSWQKDSWMENSDYNKGSVNAKVEFQISSKTKLSGNLAYADYYSDTGGSIDSIAFYQRKYASTTDFTYRKSEALRTKLTLEHEWNQNAKSFITGFQRMNKYGQNPSYGIRWNPSKPNVATGEINTSDFTSLGLVAQHSQYFEKFKTNVIVGGMLDVSPNDYWSYLLELGTVLRPDKKSVEKYYITKERPDVKIADYHADIKNYASYTQFDINPWEPMKISLGLRYDVMSFTYANALDKTNGDISYKKLTPKIGIVYSLGKENAVYGNFSKGFAPPSLSAIFRKKPNTNPAEFYYNLQPAEFNNYEVGGWFNFLKNNLRIETSLYYLKGFNELLNIRQPDNSYDYQSAGETLHKGIELAVFAKLGSQISFRSGGTYTKHEFVDFQISNKSTDVIKNLGGYEMPSAPNWIWNSELNYRPNWLKGLRTSLEWQKVSSWYQNQINTVKYDGYNVLNFRAGYSYKNWEFYTNVLNLTNSLYATNVSRGNNTTDRSTYTPAPPRTFVTGIQYQLNFKK